MTNKLWLVLMIVVSGMTASAQGLLVVEVGGMPTGFAPWVEVTKPNSTKEVITKTTTYSQAGTYHFVGKSLRIPGKLVDKIFDCNSTTVACPSTTDTAYASLQYVYRKRTGMLWFGVRGNEEQGGKLVALSEAELLGNPISQPKTQITTPHGADVVALDAQGNIWYVHTQEGEFYLARLTPDRLQFNEVAEPELYRFEGLGAWSIHPTPNGGLLLGDVVNDRVYIITAQTLASPGDYPLPQPLDGIPSNPAFDAHGDMYFFKHDAVYKVAQGEWENLHADPVQLKTNDEGVLNGTHQLVFDKKGTLWSANENGSFSWHNTFDDNTKDIPTIVWVDEHTDLIGLQGIATDNIGNVWAINRYNNGDLYTWNVEAVQDNNPNGAAEVRPNKVYTDIGSEELGYTSLWFNPAPLGSPLAKDTPPMAKPATK